MNEEDLEFNWISLELFSTVFVAIETSGYAIATLTLFSWVCEEFDYMLMSWLEDSTSSSSLVSVVTD